jgi:hypothetical protein
MVRLNLKEKAQRYTKEEKKLWEDVRHGMIIGSKKFVDKVRIFIHYSRFDTNTLADHLYKNMVPESLVEELQGRAGKTETRRTYTMGQTIKNLNTECILKLDYGIDLTHLKVSRFVPED